MMLVASLILLGQPKLPGDLAFLKSFEPRVTIHQIDPNATMEEQLQAALKDRRQATERYDLNSKVVKSLDARIARLKEQARPRQEPTVWYEISISQPLGIVKPLLERHTRRAVGKDGTFYLISGSYGSIQTGAKNEVQMRVTEPLLRHAG
jgi:hypothetical protein